MWCMTHSYSALFNTYLCLWSSYMYTLQVFDPLPIYINLAILTADTLAERGEEMTLNDWTE